MIASPSPRGGEVVPQSGATSVSFVVPSFNEELNLENAFSEILEACAQAAGQIRNVEFILVNDGSGDRTGEIMEQLKEKNSGVRCIHHPTNLGLGAAFKRGATEANHEYVLWIPGENTVPAKTICSILNEIGKADLVITYPLNLETRPVSRQIVSHAFSLLARVVSPYAIRYYNGPNLLRRAAVLSALPQTNGHAFQLEMLIKLLRKNCSYIQLGILIRDRPAGKSKAIRPKNALQVLSTLYRIWRN